MKYKLVIFDLDGTLLDTLDDLTASVNFALSECGFPTRTKDEVRSFVGDGIRMLVLRAVPENTSEEDADKVFDTFHAHYSKHCADRTRPYDKARETVAALRAQGAKVAVVTNKAQYAAEGLIERFFPGLIDACAGQREGIRTKPAPDAVFEVLSKTECEINDAVYVGDADTDIQTAKNAGCKCISVTWGFRSRDFLISRGAQITVNTFSELYNKITEY